MENNFNKVLAQTNYHSELWNGQLACFETDKSTSFEPNVVHKLLPVYIYGLIERGWIKISSDEKTIEAKAGDLIIYLPGLQPTGIKPETWFRGRPTRSKCSTCSDFLRLCMR